MDGEQAGFPIGHFERMRARASVQQAAKDEGV